MAAPMLQRLLLSVRTSVNCRSFRLNGRRGLLSAAYTDPSVWEQREADPQSLAALATLMDKSQEKKIAISSLTISRFVDNLSCREEVDQAEYYLYKFRHSPNCWYLRDWTIHSWIRQCLKHKARDKALYTLKNKVQFGIFPDEFSFNLLLDSYLKDEDYRGAIAVVEEVMLQEAFDLPSTQMLSLFALSKYLGGRPEISWQEERNVGAALLLAGLKQENTAGLSAQLLGHALIGKVEMTRGIHSVFHHMPLTWSCGYLGRALQVMERVCNHAGELKLSTHVVDDVQRILKKLSSGSNVEAAEQNLTEQQAGLIDEEDEQERAKLPEYMSKFQELKERLQAQGKLDARTLDSLSSLLVKEKLAVCEESDVAQYQDRLRLWETERLQLVQREKETRQKVKQASKKAADGVQ